MPYERDELFYLYERIKEGNITLNRKMLSEIAIADEQAFKALVEQAKAAR